MVLDYATLSIAIVALVASLYSVYEARRQNRISQDPVIVGNVRETETEYAYCITNKGNGPAYFTSVASFLNLQKLEGVTLREKVREHLSEKGIRFNMFFTTLGQETVMAPGETIEIVKIKIHPEDALKMRDIQDSVFGIKITYRSTYGVKKVWANDDRLKRT